MRELSGILLAFFILVIFFAVTSSAFAQSTSSQSVLLAKEEVVYRDYIGMGDEVRILGTVNGDAYLGGRNVIVEGAVNGDLLVFGGIVTLVGDVRDDVRIIGGQVNVLGRVGRNLTVLGGSINIPSSASVGGSVVAASGQFSLFAPVGKDVRVKAGTVIVGSKIGGDLKTSVDKLSLLKGASVRGDLVYWSKTRVKIPQDLAIEGRTIFHQTPLFGHVEQRYIQKLNSFLLWSSIAVRVGSIVVAFFVGVVLVWLFPVFTRQTADIVKLQPWKSFFLGFITFILLPLLAVAFFITVIGFPIGLILLLLFLLAVSLSEIFVALVIGEQIQQKSGRKPRLVSALLLGLLIYGIITFIPFIGWIAWTIAAMVGSGALILQKRRLYLLARGKEII
jgi:hypothetical protein